MDPQQAYQDLRAAMDVIGRTDSDSGGDDDPLADAIDDAVDAWTALDGWLRRGGFPPLAWTRRSGGPLPEWKHRAVRDDNDAPWK